MYSAARTSGRRSSSSDGRPSGSTGGEGSMPMACPRGMARLMMSRGERPSSTARAASAWSTDTVLVCTWARAVSTSALARCQSSSVMSPCL